MSDNNEKKVQGIVAEYESVDSLLDACRRVRDAGYKKTDAFAPFAVHGIDKAIGIKPTVLPWIVLACGLAGTATALVMQIWMNAIDYPYIISGKPFISLPAFMPVAFELTVLFASFGAFFGMWALNGLPRFSNPMFTDPRFDRVTDDRFFLYVDAKDDKFDAQSVEKLFSESGGQYIQKVVEDDSSPKIPKPFFLLWGLIIGFSVIPLLIVLKMRVTNSSQPRFHVFYDMDFSPAKDAQQRSTLFADGRAMRPDVPGTVARGEVGQDMNFLTGIDMPALSVLDASRAERLVRAHMNPQPPQVGNEGDSEEAAADGAGCGRAAAATERDGYDALADAEPAGDQYGTARARAAILWHLLFGLPRTQWWRQRPGESASQKDPGGDMDFPLLVAPGHLVRREVSRRQVVQHDQQRHPQDARICRANQIADRWAIVAYVRALQQSQNASIDLVPQEERDEIAEATGRSRKEPEGAGRGRAKGRGSEQGRQKPPPIRHNSQGPSSPFPTIALIRKRFRTLHHDVKSAGNSAFHLPASLATLSIPLCIGGVIPLLFGWALGNERGDFGMAVYLTAFIYCVTLPLDACSSC